MNIYLAAVAVQEIMKKHIIQSMLSRIHLQLVTC